MEDADCCWSKNIGLSMSSPTVFRNERISKCLRLALRTGGSIAPFLVFIRPLILCCTKELFSLISYQYLDRAEFMAYPKIRALNVTVSNAELYGTCTLHNVNDTSAHSVVIPCFVIKSCWRATLRSFVSCVRTNSNASSIFDFPLPFGPFEMDYLRNVQLENDTWYAVHVIVESDCCFFPETFKSWNCSGSNVHLSMYSAQTNE